MHGIQIKQVTETANLVGSPNKKKKLQSGNIEETKINFFDPSMYGEQQAPYEKPAEDQIIVARFDAVDWRAELDRVYMELASIEKDTQLVNGYGGVLPEQIEECRRHYDLIEEMCKEIKMAVNQDVQRVFQRTGESLSSDLSKVRLHEQRINAQNES